MAFVSADAWAVMSTVYTQCVNTPEDCQIKGSIQYDRDYYCKQATGNEEAICDLKECSNFQCAVPATEECTFEKICQGADSEWVNIGVGYERRTCVQVYTTCERQDVYEYRCAEGYYGSVSVGSGGYTGCTQCPEASNTYTTAALTTKVRGTCNAGSRTSANCHVPEGQYYDHYGRKTIANTPLSNGCYYATDLGTIPL